MEDYLWYESTQSLAYNLSLPNEHAVSQSDPPLPAISVFFPPLAKMEMLILKLHSRTSKPSA